MSTEDAHMDPEDSDAADDSSASLATSNKKKSSRASDDVPTMTKKSSAKKTKVSGKKGATAAAAASKTKQSQNGSLQGVEDGASAAESSGKGSKSRTSNKTYVQMIHEAIEALKDRTGSSVPAIKKWLLQEYPNLDVPQFKHRINQGVKTGVTQGRFEKVRSSFKIKKSWKEAERAKKRKSAQAKAKAKDQKGEGAKNGEQSAPKTYKDLVKFNKVKLAAVEKTMPQEEFKKLKAQMRKKEEALHKKEEAEKKERIRQERIRKRRFPMEDTKLHAEDKELGVKPPSDVRSRPALPYFWQVVLPLGDPNRQGKTSDTILRYSKVDGLDQGNRGLVPDLLQIYHFFRGDVHFTGDNWSMEDVSKTKRKKRGSNNSKEEGSSWSLVPEFSLSNLIYATEEILNGNARRSRLIPPLISHLFVTCLQLLLREPEESNTEKDPRHHLQYELHKYVLPALSPASWPDICHLYMDAMHRFFGTDSSRDPNVLQGLNTDLNYLFCRIDEPTIPMTPFVSGDGKEEAGIVQHPLPDGFMAYLGEPTGVLHRAHDRLGRSEAWSLTAEEILTLLRALTDDVLASYPGIAENIARRDEEMGELLKAKKAADSKFRKVRLAYEGPKRVQKKTADGGATNATSNTGEQNGESSKENDVFKPTATKKEFESASRAQQKANDAYEKGIRRLVSRTEPIGYDRMHNAVYCFRHDPEILYVEERRPPVIGEHSLPEELQFQRRSWHIIETTSLFDSFTESLDIRGKREQDLYESLLGAPGTQQSLRRYLHDDVKAKAETSSRRREKEALQQRLEAARVKCDEEKGRRSGRLADQAEVELAAVQQEIEDFENKQTLPVEQELSYEELTGLTLLRAYDKPDRRETRRAREQKAAVGRSIPLLPCSELIPTGHIDGTGIVGMLVQLLLHMEEQCQAVAPMESKDARQTWISKVEGSVHTWYNMNPLQIGPSTARTTPATPSDSATARSSVGGSSSKKRRESNTVVPGMPSVSTIISSLRQPLLDIEARVADITNVATASRDAELADDNMSTDSSEDRKEELELAWKRELHRLRQITGRQHLKIRERVVNAISLARKAHQPDVVAKLRAALLLYHPNAASDCRKEALEILESSGDYDGSDVDEDLEDDDDEMEEDKAETDEIVSVLSAEAALLTCCLGGSDEATRADWIDLVKSCRTLSRLASLTTTLAAEAERKLHKLSEERDDLLHAISTWQKGVSRSRAGKKNRDPPPFSAPSEVWADVRMTDDICMVKAEQWPWWPAKTCEVKDEELRKTLNELNHVLVALVGEMGGLRIVQGDKIREFTGKPIVDEDAGEMNKKTKNELEEALAMGRRIKRGMEKLRNSKGGR